MTLYRDIYRIVRFYIVTSLVLMNVILNYGPCSFTKTGNINDISHELCVLTYVLVGWHFSTRFIITYQLSINDIMKYLFNSNSVLLFCYQFVNIHIKSIFTENMHLIVALYSSVRLLIIDRCDYNNRMSSIQAVHISRICGTYRIHPLSRP